MVGRTTSKNLLILLETRVDVLGMTVQNIQKDYRKNNNNNEERGKSTIKLNDNYSDETFEERKIKGHLILRSFDSNNLIHNIHSLVPLRVIYFIY